MKTYTVSGMSCAACSNRVEKAVGALSGVENCSVNLLTNSMTVEGSAKPEDVIRAVEQAGYGASVQGETPANTKDDAFADTETPKLKKRLISSVLFLLALMYVSMGHTMFGLYLPPFLAENPMSLGMLQMILAAIVMIINKDFFVGGAKAILHGAPNMDTLVAIGSFASFGYSTVCLFLMSDALVSGNTETVHRYAHDLYFESAAMIVTLITVGKMLEAYSKGKTVSAIKSLQDLSPKQATVLRDGVETVISAEEIRVGDTVIVKPGGVIPADGVITEGSCAVDESALTGESIPKDKTVGDTLSAGTVNQSGYIRFEAKSVGEDTGLSAIICMVTESAATKAPIARIADKVSGKFVPFVLICAFLTVLVWLIAGAEAGYALARGISVLVISCPCALVLATPVAIMVGNGVGARHGILFKNARALEELGKIRTVALDKTGTVTKGEPAVTDILPMDITEAELLSLACTLEQKSEHPLAKAVMRFGAEQGAKYAETEDFKVHPGNGITAISDGVCMAGNASFISEYAEIPKELSDKADALAEAGKTPMYFAKDGKCVGLIAVADTVKEDSKTAVSRLQNTGIYTALLTGDNEKTANAVKELVGADAVFAELLPKDKQDAVRKLQNKGTVAMVGDGINDAVALTAADIGIAIGAGTDVAIESADVVLMNSRLIDVVAAMHLSRKTLKNIRQNLFWAFLYNVICIPLAAGVWVPVTGIAMSPMLGALCMSLSSFSVVTNALRLNFADIYTEKNDKKIKEKGRIKEKKNMEIVLKIEGMMCPHCEARVKKVLEEIDGVASVDASHEKGTAVVVLTKDVPKEVLKQTVTEQGYTVE